MVICSTRESSSYLTIFGYERKQHVQTDIHIMRVEPPSTTKKEITSSTFNYRQLVMNPANLFKSGLGLLTERFMDSDYGCFDSSKELEHEPETAVPPLVGVFAVEKGSVLSQMYIYDAHKKIPMEEDFSSVLNFFRKKDFGKTIIHFGSLASAESLKNNRRIIGSIFKEGFNFAEEISFTRAFACVHPKHVRFYEHIIGFRTIASVNCVTGLEKAPGVLMDETPNTVNTDYIKRM